MVVKKITKVTNNAGSTTTFVNKRLDNGETYIVNDLEIPKWRNDPTISGAIGSGTLIIGSDLVTFTNPQEGLIHFFDLDVDKITVSGTSFIGDVTFSGIGGIAVSSGTEAPNVVTVSGEPPPTTSGQVIDQNFITINRVRIGFGKNGDIDGAYMRVEGTASNNTGHVMIRPAQLTGIAGYYDGGASKKDFKIRKNGVSTDLASFTMQRKISFIDENFPTTIEFDSGDRIQVFVASSGSKIRDPNVWMEIAWRAV